MQLLIGCGNSRTKKMFDDARGSEWRDLVTLDVDPSCRPDVVHDLESLPLPFADDSAAEVHAYEVLEHCGRQGDWRFFFAQFAEFWRVLEPGGMLFASVPRHDSEWAWGDPGHTRVIPPHALLFLHQPAYSEQVGKTAMTDYRSVYRADFDVHHTQVHGANLFFVLQAIKPSRVSV